MAPPKINSWLRHCLPVTRTRARSVTVRLAGAFGAVRLAVRGFAIRGSWVPCSWVRRSWVVGSPFVGSWVCCSLVRRSWVRRSPVDDLAGGATISTFWVRNLSLSFFARVLSLSLSLFVRLRKLFEGKILAENIFRVKDLNFTVNGNSFPKNPFSRRNRTPAFPEKTNTALGAREQCFFNSREGWISRVGPTVRPPSLRGERR